MIKFSQAAEYDLCVFCEQPMWKCYMCGECARYDSSTLQQIINNGEDNVQDNFDRNNRADE